MSDFQQPQAEEELRRQEEDAALERSLAIAAYADGMGKLDQRRRLTGQQTAGRDYTQHTFENGTEQTTK